MTARRRLIPNREVKSLVDMFREMGITFGAIEVRGDGVIFHPANQPEDDPYAQWARKNPDRD